MDETRLWMLTPHGDGWLAEVDTGGIGKFSRVYKHKEEAIITMVRAQCICELERGGFEEAAELLGAVDTDFDPSTPNLRREVE
jgi:hypothetical protein